MKEIKILGRGGQGAVTGAQVLATAAFLEGYWAQTFPQFGAERRGAPVIAYVRLAHEMIPIRSKVYTPDVVIVMDFNLFKMARPLDGLKPGGTAIVNCNDRHLETLYEVAGGVDRLYRVDATDIAHKTYGRTPIPITNIVIIGAYCAVQGDVSLDAVCKALPDFFPEDKLDINMEAAKRGYENVRVVSAHSPPSAAPAKG
jgi:2-oxoacid:acceptor oxidoreductase gamma subunit (pyruvate/2-ketoisovalerate family)